MLHSCLVQPLLPLVTSVAVSVAVAAYDSVNLRSPTTALNGPCELGMGLASSRCLVGERETAPFVRSMSADPESPYGRMVAPPDPPLIIVSQLTWARSPSIRTSLQNGWPQGASGDATQFGSGML